MLEQFGLRIGNLWIQSERDVTDLEFYFWDRSEPLLLEDVGWLNSGDMLWSTRFVLVKL